MLVFGYRFFKSRSGDKTAESCVRELSRVSFGDHLLNDGSPVTGRCGPFEPFNSDLTISRRPLGKRHDPTVVYSGVSTFAASTLASLETTLPARILQTSHDLI